jgi:hypothetical protein
LRPEDAGIDPSGSAMQVLWEPGSMGPDEWLTVASRASVTRTKRALPRFTIYRPSSRDLCLIPLAADLLKDSPGPTKYRVELVVSGERTLMDQAAVLHFETRKSYDVREFYRSAIEERMPVCPALGIR